MRFEQKSFIQKIKTLEKFHNVINEVLFHSELQPIPLDIKNLNKCEASDVWGAFEAHAYHFDVKKNTHINEVISISHEFVDYLSSLKTQKLQILDLSQVILHEMVHQYCYEKGIEDKNHGAQWQKVAQEHELISIYENGNPKEETLTIVARSLLYYYLRNRF